MALSVRVNRRSLGSKTGSTMTTLFAAPINPRNAAAFQICDQAIAPVAILAEIAGGRNNLGQMCHQARRAKQKEGRREDQAGRNLFDALWLDLASVAEIAGVGNTAAVLGGFYRFR
jgi:hypothetical protein